MKKLQFLKKAQFYFFFLSFFCFIQAKAQPIFVVDSTSNSPKDRINSDYGDEVVATQMVTLNTPALLDGPDLLGLRLFGNAITIQRNRNSITPNDIFYWWGSVIGDPYSYVIFASSGSATNLRTIFSANIFWKNSLYQLRYIGEDIYEVRKIDQSKLPEEERAIDETASGPTNEVAIVCPNTDPPSVIDVMVVYTDSVLMSAGYDVQVVESDIYLAVHETNLAYFNSNVNQRIGLVHISNLTGYKEKATAGSNLAFIKNDQPTLLKRNQFFADIVVLMVKGMGNACGEARIMKTVSTSFENQAYCVVKRRCTTAKYTFAHELAHIMGCMHDRKKDLDTQPYPYAHAYCMDNGQKKFATVMTHMPNCSLAVRIPYFSNPNVFYEGLATGTIAADENLNTADNHLTLNNTAPIVANFRCHSGNTPNVWMKDTWNDDGSEPSAWTPWNSPDIWVRNEEDPNLLHIHDHEDPIAGADNWVYVKLHNGGDTTTGNLELYYAQASLTPPDWTDVNSWIPLANISVSIGASTSKIVSYKWSGIATAPDYMLIARWVSSSDPMAVAETSNVSDNVMNNNNIAWKNFKVVDLSAKQENKIVMPFMAKKGTSIELDFEDNFPQQSFAQQGRVMACFDFKTGFNFARTIQGSGFKRIHKNLFLVTNPQVKFENLGDDIARIGQIKLKFCKKKSQPSRKYYCHIRQVDMDEKLKTIEAISGITCEINLEKSYAVHQK